MLREITLRLCHASVSYTSFSPRGKGVAEDFEVTYPSINHTSTSVGLRVTRSGTLPLPARVRRTKQMYVIYSVDVCSFISTWHLLHRFKAQELTNCTYLLAHRNMHFLCRSLFLDTAINLKDIFNNRYRAPEIIGEFLRYRPRGR